MLLVRSSAHTRVHQIMLHALNPHCACPNMDHSPQLTQINDSVGLLCQNVRVVRRQMYLRPEIQQRP